MTVEHITYGPGGYKPDQGGNVAGRASVTLPPEQVNADTIRAQAVQALATNRTYVAIGTPTAAQTTAEVKALARQMNGVIRLLLGALDGTD